MLAKARIAAPSCHFEQGDFASWEASRGPASRSDLIYSNAALQWVGGHAISFPRLMSLLAPHGVLAVQMPAMHDAPLRQLQYTIAGQGPWADRLASQASAPPILDAAGYWDLLRPLAASLDIWETIYLHPLTGEDAVVEWAAGSSLRPFLEPLVRAEQAAFQRGMRRGTASPLPASSGRHDIAAVPTAVPGGGDLTAAIQRGPTRMRRPQHPS